jgi:hypothetical protein
MAEQPGVVPFGGMTPDEFCEPLLLMGEESDETNLESKGAA